ncbi:uncharacterized protein LOC143198659 [Rhynchophorus ferrugineus]|uniref:uncharacterized protein LOC143198659 n=1 Tax=Rhynchophorus ferrugineus TaxID=354439 RepID=UPI003FCC2E2E
MSSCYRRVNFYDLCRLCAQSFQENKVKIFDQKGQEIQLQSKIKKCLSMTITEDDFLPKVVCPKCIDQLEICNAFREECRKSEKMLSSYFKNYRHTEDFKKSGEVYIKDTVKNETSHDVVHNNTKLNTPNKDLYKRNDTELCGKLSGPIIHNSSKKTKLGDLNPNTIISSTQNIQIPYSLDLLNESLKKAVQQLPKDIISKVVVNFNGEIINVPQSEVITIDPLNVSNVIMGLSNVSKNKCIKNSSEKIIKESVTLEPNIVKMGFTESDKSEATNKINMEPFNKSPETNIPTIQNTPVIFPVSQYQNNFLSTQPSRPFSQQPAINITPSMINTSSDNNGDITSTENLPTNQSPPSSINLDDLRPTTYLSNTSSKIVDEFPSKKGLAKEESLQKTHICEVCSKSFKRREHLYQHYKLHSSLRPYRCVECNKSFVRKEHLIRHMVLHSGERNFSCEICKKSFSRHDNLLKHIRTHNKESNYTCDVCQRIFVFKHYLDVHRSVEGKCYLPPQVRAC